MVTEKERSPTPRDVHELAERVHEAAVENQRLVGLSRERILESRRAIQRADALLAAAYAKPPVKA